MDLGNVFTGMPAQYYLKKWTKNGILDNISNDLVAKERVRQGKEAEATAGAIDSQSIKKGCFYQVRFGNRWE